MTDNHGTHTYTYDDVYQLTNATHPQAYNPNESFTYDPVGNRLTSHLSSAYVYDNLNRLLEDDDYTYTYDNNGNLVSKVDKISIATTNYQYDDENGLIQVVTPTDIVQYQYDGFGRRIAKNVNGVVTKYVYDREDILFEVDANGNIKARYTHGPGIDEPISVDRDTNGDGVLDTTYYYHYDGLGSVTTITGTTGNVVNTYEYDTFGNIVNQTGSVENAYTYTAREWDAEAGLYFYRARYYDAEIGRFINGDPIGFAGGDVNFYVYVQNNPINLLDPYGLDWLDASANVAAGFADTITMGGTSLLRQQFDINDVVDKCSGTYTAGEYTGYAWFAATAWTGGLYGGTKSVFWSGRGVSARASQYGKIITKTPIGSILNRFGEKIPNVVWNIASATFAGNAKGTATKVGIEAGRIWSKIEQPILRWKKIPIKEIP